MEVHMSVILRPEFPGSPVPCKDAGDDSAASPVHAPPAARSSDVTWYEIRTIDGRCLSRTHGLGHDGKWRWVTSVICGDAECHYEDIDLEEATDRDYITVRGKRYAVVNEDFSDTADHHAAMAEREEIIAKTALQVSRARVEMLEKQIDYLHHQIDIWRDRCEASDQALESCIREWNKEQRGEY
jgi:hypothetical protein